MTMTLEEIYEHIRQDFPVDQTDLVNESVKNTTLFSKYIILWSTERNIYDKLMLSRKELYNKKMEYYSGNASPEEYKKKPFNLKLKTEAVKMSYVESDEDVIKFNRAIVTQEIKVDVLEHCLKEIKNRGYQVKNIIDYTKFINGE